MLHVACCMLRYRRTQSPSFLDSKQRYEIKMGSEALHKIKNNADKQRKIFLLCTALCIVFMFFSKDLGTFFHEGTEEDFHDLKTAINPHDASLKGFGTNESLDLNAFKKCSTNVSSFKAPETFTTKPIWMAMPPYTISDPFHKKLINPLTGTSAGAKSFYASMKGKLRHCIGNGQSVTCLNIHPSIEMNNGMPDSYSDRFYSKYIIILENPMTSIPSGYNAKSEKYGGTVGQMGEEEWRKARDLWFEGMLKSWKETITTWNSTKNYAIGMYLVNEDLYDTEKGPSTVSALRSFLNESGFAVAPEEDVECIWFNAVGEESITRFHKFHYDYEDYFPGFTQNQKDLMLKELKELKNEFATDVQLVQVLDRYCEEIESRLKIDKSADDSIVQKG